MGALLSIYRAVIEPPIGITIKLRLEIIVCNSTTKKISLSVIVYAAHQVYTGYFFGSLTWKNELHAVRIPLSVKTEILQTYDADDN